MSGYAEWLSNQLDIDGLHGILAQQIETLIAENERLRAALQEIDTIAVSKQAGSAVRMQRIARAALAGGSQS